MHNTPPWVDSIRANFDYIAKKLLPSSSAADNGKVLTVVDGEWAAAPASGGGGLTLYGPYFAVPDPLSPLTVHDGDTETASLTIYNDIDGHFVSFPDGTPFIAVLESFSSQEGKLIVNAVSVPVYSGDQVYDAYMMVTNMKGSDVTTIGFSVSFYCSIELPLAE